MVEAKQQRVFAHRLKTKGIKLYEATLECELLRLSDEQMDELVPNKRMKRLRRFLDGQIS